MNLSKLTPAPFVVEGADRDGNVSVGAPPPIQGGSGPLIAVFGSTIADNKTHAEFFALARNAFDAMTRRGWWAQPWSAQAGDGCGGWIVCYHKPDQPGAGVRTVMPSIIDCRGHPEWCRTFPDPFTALVEADKWYVANVESKTDQPR